MTAIRTPGTTLACAGGTPVRSVPLPRWPSFDADDAAAVQEVLASGDVNYWTGGRGRRFESEFAAWAGAPYGVAVANGTVALEIALAALGIGPGDEVVVPSVTFIATASAVVTRGAVPVVVDVAPDTQCMTADGLAAAVTERTRAVIVVHLAGFPADMAALRRVARDNGLRVVEDCAQAHGARRDGRGVGTVGDVAAWSFCQDKIMTTAGEGGMITTGDEALWRRCWELKDHGKSYAAVFEREHPPGFRWVHESFGTNARMTEVQAAVGLTQLRKIDRWVATRRAHAAVLRDRLGDIPSLRLPPVVAGAEPAYYRFYLHVRDELLAPGWDRDRIAAAIRAEGIPCANGGCTEIHRERAFDSVGRPDRPLPVAAELGRTSLALLVHPTLGAADIADSADAVEKVMYAATA
ncbi:MAG: DegT/DnrJ/EryC1/StrS aminotransferase family protein [Pseudonocardia sp.]|nr:DegT/DnrJ/EryC1/StrS aminotransferase family protein [Pseudonocardia sp.]